MEKKIESVCERTETFKYGYKVWMKNGDKYSAGFYNLEDVLIMKKTLEANKEVFEITVTDENGTVETASI